MSISPKKYVSPVNIIKSTLDMLISKIQQVKHIAEKASGDYHSENIEITQISDMKLVYKIKKETHTIGQLIRKYCLLVDPTIVNIHCPPQDFSVNRAVINITHAEPEKIMLIALTRIIKDLNTLKLAF